MPIESQIAMLATTHPILLAALQVADTATPGLTAYGLRTMARRLLLAAVTQLEDGDAPDLPHRATCDE